MKRKLISLVPILALSAGLFAQASLNPSSSTPKIDGSIEAGEYQFTTEDSGMNIGATLGEDGKLYLSIRAKTGGWVALGLGEGRMDGSHLFLAYDTGKKQVFNEQKGVGHRHKDLADPVVEKWAVKAEGGYMSLELVVPASAAISEGKIGLLYAYSGSTMYMFPHKARGAMTMQVSG